MRSPRRSPHTVPPEPAPEAVSPDPCLSFCLIRGRTAAFTGGRVRPVDAGHAPCRPLANTRAQSSKACEGATLPWVQIPPPPLRVTDRTAGVAPTELHRWPFLIVPAG